MDMISTLRTLACAAAALAITMFLSWSFVFSTSTVPFGRTAQAPLQATAHAPSHPHHLAFARSGPAVLVD
jgi:hypothetical protein